MHMRKCVCEMESAAPPYVCVIGFFFPLDMFAFPRTSAMKICNYAY